MPLLVLSERNQHPRVMLDYARTISDARTMTASPRHWFWGTSVPTLAASEFLERWSGHAGSLCSLSPTNAAGQGGRLVVHLSASSPVALCGSDSRACHACFCVFLGPMLVLCSAFSRCLLCVGGPSFQALVFFHERWATALAELWPLFPHCLHACCLFVCRGLE